MHEKLAGQRRAVKRAKTHLNDTRNYVRFVLESLPQEEDSTKVRLNGILPRKKLGREPVFATIVLPSRQSKLVVSFVGDRPQERDAALAVLSYLDKAGEQIEGPYEGISTSEKVGPYAYLRMNAEGAAEIDLNAPSNAVTAVVGFRTWSAKKPVYLSSSMELRWNKNQDVVGKLKKALWHIASVTSVVETFASNTTSNGPVVLSAMDEISSLNWSRELNLDKLNRAHYKAQIETSKPAFLLLESAWKANDGDWEYAFLSPGLKHPNAKAMVDAIETAKAEKVPVVFWNKEDPLHYDKFLPIAQKADFIFTTDSNCVDRYKSDTSSKVDVMPFAANLAVTNPIGRYTEPNGSVCFAGGWYSVGHDERTRQMNYMLEPILKFEGAIYDRHSIHNNDRYAYPERFREHIRPAVNFAEMTKLYRRFKVFLNVNTIIDSPTMMSRRVYELLASGTPVVSAPSAAIEAQFEGIVSTATNKKAAENAVERLLSDDVFWRKTSHRGVREVVKKHQYKHLADRLSSAVFDKGPAAHEPLVSIIMSTKRERFVDRIIENLSRQKGVNFDLHFALGEQWSEQNIAKLEGILQANKFAKRIKVTKFPAGALLGDKLNSLILECRGDFISKFDDDDFYFENYLADTMGAFDLGDFDVVGKHSHPIYMESDDTLLWKAPEKRSIENNHVSGATITARRSLFRSFPFASKGSGEDTAFLTAVKVAGGRIYSTDEFNFIQYRAASAEHHTWRADEDVFRRMGRHVGSRKSFSDWIV